MFRHLLSEQQMPWKDAIPGQAVCILSRHQINSVPSHQLHVQDAAGCDGPSLPGGEGVQNSLIVTEKVQTGIVGIDGGVEAELVNAWNRAGEIAIPRVVTSLSIVDDDAESNGLARFGEVVAQFDREGNIRSSTRRYRNYSWSLGYCKRGEKRIILKPYCECFS